MSSLAPFSFPGATAVLTGAAGGIGEHLAHGLAARGTHLVLIDRDTAGLERVAGAIRREHGDVRVRTTAVDLADLTDLPRLVEEILGAHPRIDLLINNAGIALGGTFEQASAEEFDEIVDVNFRAPVVLTRLLLPALLEASGGHLVNVSSVFGLVAPPGQAAYASSKYALRGFTEALRHELAGRVGVTVVHPGGVRTGIAASSRIPAAMPPEQGRADREAFGALLRHPPERAAEEILRAVERRRGRLLVAPNAAVLDLAARLLPGSYWPALRAVHTLLQRRPGSRGRGTGQQGSWRRR